MAEQHFKTRIVAGETKNVAGIEIPAEVVEALGAGQRPRVQITLNDYSYGSTIAKMGGVFMIGLSAEHRKASGLAGGDAVDVSLEVLTEAPAIEIPADLRAALQSAGALDAFEKAAPSRRKEWVRQVEEAKAADTRARRIEKVVSQLSG